MLGEHGVSVDMAQLVSKVELSDEKVQDMAKVVEVMTEVLVVETGDRTIGLHHGWNRIHHSSHHLRSRLVRCPLRSKLSARHVLRVQQC